MSFDAAKFEQAKFTPRTKAVHVPALSDFFGDDECLWTVRGLTSNELHKAAAADSTQKALTKILAAISENDQQAKQAGGALGIYGETPGEIAKRLEMLVAGSVTPEITLPVAVKLAENFPIEFLQLTNEITELTGLGFEYAKQKAASKKTTS
jgi:hypothetical protein